MKITRFELQPGQANPAGNTPPSADDYAKLRASEVRRDLEDRLAELESQLQESATNVAAPEPELVRTRARRIGRPRGPHAIQTGAEIERSYRRVWSTLGHRPFWSEVALDLGVDVRTLKRARDRFEVQGSLIDAPDS